jgi:hypothetical protein
MPEIPLKHRSVKEVFYFPHTQKKAKVMTHAIPASAPIID